MRALPLLLALSLPTAGAGAATCESYRAEAGALSAPSIRGDGLRLRLARCLRDAGEMGDAEREYRALLDRNPLARSPHVLEEASAFFASSLRPLPESLDRAVSLEIPKDRPRREALARALFVLSKDSDPSRAARARDRLFLDLPDTAAAREMLATPAGREREARTTREEAVRRARALLEAPDAPAALAVLQPYAPAAGDASSGSCEARVLLARILRRVGRTTDALSAARLAAAACEGEPAAEASYLDVLLTSGRDEDPETKVERFLQRFPQDTRCDDVILQRAQLLARGPDPRRAAPLFESMLARYPAGDMAQEARFLLALERAREGSVPAALRLLDEAARPDAPEEAAVRASYWRARLRLQPRLDRLALTPDAAVRKSAARELQRLAEDRFGSYYGLLARQLLRAIPEAQPGAPGTPGTKTRAIRAVSVEPPAPRATRLAEDAEYAGAASLAGLGLGSEAQIVLDLLVDRLGALSATERLEIAAVFRAAGAPARALRLLSPAEGRLAVAAPPPRDERAPAAYAVLFPRLFDDALEGAATSAGVPAELLRAVAREESILDPAAVSPTGAVGLCQIQEPAAREAAAILGRSVPGKQELLDPGLNALVGATYLRRRLDTLGHPLLAVAAYNRGPTSIASLARKLGPIPIDLFVERIPARETREYVKRVAGSWDAYAILDAGTEGISIAPAVPSRSAAPR